MLAKNATLKNLKKKINSQICIIEKLFKPRHQVFQSKAIIGLLHLDSVSFEIKNFGMFTHQKK